jgi:UDP-N-acetylmuramoylalanine--D-glutamate ligase
LSSQDPPAPGPADDPTILQRPGILRSPIGIAGWGSSGQAAAIALASVGFDVIACDARTDLPPSPHPRIQLRPGSHDLSPCRDVVLSPSFNPEWPENQSAPHLAPWWEAARRQEIRLFSEVEIARLLRPLPWITVGGTDGKSTTAALCAHLYRHLSGPVLLGGNSWTAISDVIRSTPEARAAVVEVSAFQLWARHQLRPDIAILTNIAEDHLDHYGTMDRYVAAKRHILANLDGSSTAIVNSDDQRLRGFIDPLLDQGVRVLAFGDRPCDHDRVTSYAWHDADGLHLQTPAGTLSVGRHSLAAPGPHNARNALAAAWAVIASGGAALELPRVSELADALSTFRGLPHRTELVATRGHARWYNDSKATNAHAALAGLRGMRDGTVVIAGGVDKGLDLSELVAQWEAMQSPVVVIGAIAERMMDEARGRVDIRSAASLERAVELASELSDGERDVVFSPACSSFDMFRSFEHRGDVFRQLAGAISGGG